MELNFKLQHALTKQDGVGFTEIDGYPKTEWLLKVSQAAKDSDYLFIKEIMLALFPNGIGNATVSGRPSNNPAGIRGGEAKRGEPGERSKLDPDKVNYMKGSLFSFSDIYHFNLRLYYRSTV